MRKIQLVCVTTIKYVKWKTEEWKLRPRALRYFYWVNLSIFHS